MNTRSTLYIILLMYKETKNRFRKCIMSVKGHSVATAMIASQNTEL